MAQDPLTILLDDQTLAALAGAARLHGLSMAEHAADLLASVLEAAEPARLTATLAPDFARARSWPELQGRLLLKGLELRRRDGALSVFDKSCGQVICTLTDLGQSEDGLTTRIGRPFPSPLGRWLVDAALDAAPPRAPVTPHQAARG